MDTIIQSSLGIKLSKTRDHPLHTGHQWIKGKQLDDGAEGLWRIDDKLYNFSNFIKGHPGGQMWLEVTKGTDITEAFYAHHISTLPETLLPTYLVKNASTKRNYPFTFNETDFYLTLKRRIARELLNIPKRRAVMSEIMTDLLLICYFSFTILSVFYTSLVIGVLAGVCLSMTAIASHNFFHQRDNFRMYYFDFTMMQSREWRISHALSHHIYTNTVNDLEISSLEPFMFYLPHNKNFIARYISWLYSPIIFVFLFIGHHIKTNIQMVLNKEKIRFEIFLPYILITLVIAITKQNISYALLMYMWIICVGSLHFGLIGVNAAHHHPEIFHDGDTVRNSEDMDWGIFQLDAVMDKKEFIGSHFLVLTNFGDHALHHLFPTIDHGLLDFLYPVFIYTCKEFGVVHKISSNINLIKGQYKQLANVNYNPVKPIPSFKKGTIM